MTTNQAFDFLSASALLGNVAKPATTKVCENMASLRIADEKQQAKAEDAPSLISSACSFLDDEASQLSLSCSPPSSEASAAIATSSHRHPTSLKSILKKAAKNPKSLRRGFHSMLELEPTRELIPEAGETPPTPAVVELSSALEAMQIVQEGDNDDGDDDGRFPTKPTLARSVSFNSPTIHRVKSINDLVWDKGDIWFQQDEFVNFTKAEMRRRAKLGIECETALCSEHPYDGDEDVGGGVRRNAALYPRGVIR